MNIVWATPRSSRRCHGHRSALSAVAMALLLPACTTPAEDETPSPAATLASRAPQPTPAEDPTAEVLSAYQGYIGALTEALSVGDPETPQLVERAAGQALETTRQQLQANQADGVVATGTVQIAATEAEVTVEGDRATVRDCLLNDLAQVRIGDAEEIVAEASGNRQPLTATLTLTEAGWTVSETAGPELRGPVLQGESCAPPSLEQELLNRYEAYWDAVYEAGDPGGGEPADPNAPVLEATMVDPQLADWRAAFTELRNAGQVLRVRPDTAPSVLGVFAYDQLAVVVDCVIEPEGSGVYDLASGELVQGAESAGRTLDRTDLRFDGGTWKTSNWDIGEETACTRPGE